MTHFLLQIYDYLSKRRSFAISLMVVIAAACIYSASTIDYEEDISAFLPKTGETEEYTNIYSGLGGQNRIAVLFRGNSENLIPAMDEFGELLTERDTCEMVHDLQVTIDEEKMLAMMEQVWQSYPLLLSDEQYARLNSILTGDYVERQMEENYKTTMLPISSVVTQSLPFDPLRISDSVTSTLQDSDISDHYQIIDGHIFSKDGKCGMVLLSSHFGISESRRNEELSELIQHVTDTVMVTYRDVEISSIGAPIIAVGNASQIKKDSILAVSLSIILIFTVLYYSFRRWRDILLIGVAIVFGWIVALGCLVFFSERVSVIVLGIGSVIIGIAANYPLHFLDHLKHEADKRSALKEMIPPLLIGNITTVSAFLCLVFIKAKAMRDLGIFGSLMLVGTIAFVLIFLPNIVGNRKMGKTYFILPEWKCSMPMSLRRWLLPVVCILTCVFGVCSLNTAFDPNMQHINYMTDEQREDLKMLATSMQANDTTGVIYLVSKGENLEEALMNNEKVLPLLKNVPHLHKTQGIGDLIPSRSQQAARIDKWKKFWAEHKNIQEATRNAAERHGFSANAFEPFYQLCEGNISVLDDDNLLMALLGRNYIQQDNTGEFRIVNMLVVDQERMELVKERLRESISEHDINAFAFDNTDLSNSLVTILSDSFNYIGYLCGFVVFAFLWISFGRLELTVIAFMPLAVSWLWILGLMDLGGVQFNIVNIILATFIFGQGDDYSIFITEGMVYEYTYGKKRLRTYKNSVALSAILMFIGIGSLIFAKHPALRSLAEVAIIGMGTVVLMTFYLPPLIFRWLIYKHGKVRQVPITLQRILYSLWALTFFLFFSLLFFVPYALIHYYCLSRIKGCRQLFHRILQYSARFVIYRIPGVKFNYINRSNEDLSTPAVITCNHQSHLDVMALLMMSPKIVILTNDWVWNNPFYGAIIRAAEFYPISDGLEKNIERLRNLVERGYSVVVFPEGTREFERKIMPFHQGAFAIAHELGIDILPMMIHGFSDILPKQDFMLRKGSVTIEVHQRMKAEETLKYTTRELTKKWHKWYIEQYRIMSEQLETVDYWIPYVSYIYMYKTHEAEKRSKRILREVKLGKTPYRQYIRDNGTIIIPNSGQGELAWVIALSYQHHEIYAYEEDEEMYTIALATPHKPSNLHFINDRYIG